MPSEVQRTLDDYCLYLPDDSRRPRYAPAALVLVLPSGETLMFSGADHLPAWVTQIRGRYLELERDEREARGAGYGGADTGRLTAAPLPTFGRLPAPARPSQSRPKMTRAAPRSGPKSLHWRLVPDGV